MSAASPEEDSEALSQEIEEEGLAATKLSAEQDADEAEGNESSELTASENEESWISWFVSLRGHDFFCEVDEEYIQDDFNMTGLAGLVPYYDYALDLMLDVESALDRLNEDQQEVVESAAVILYGLIHARFILTSRGMQRMREKFQSADFGRCPRLYCGSQMLLPVGLSDLPRNYSVNLFCPSCHEIYHPRSGKHSQVDGAYFGTTFPHLFLMSHPECIPKKSQQTYVPRIYGFRISRESEYYDQQNSGIPSLNTGSSTQTKRVTGAVSKLAQI